MKNQACNVVNLHLTAEQKRDVMNAAIRQHNESFESARLALPTSDFEELSSEDVDAQLVQFYAEVV